MNAQLQRFGGQISPEQLSTIEQQLFEDVKNRIINNKLLLNAIRKMGLLFLMKILIMKFLTLETHYPKELTLKIF